MNEKPGKLAVAFVLVASLLVAYPLSLGPSTWLLDRYWMDEETAEVVYGPLLWLCGCSEATQRIREKYQDMWK